MKKKAKAVKGLAALSHEQVLAKLTALVKESPVQTKEFYGEAQDFYEEVALYVEALNNPVECPTNHTWLSHIEGSGGQMSTLNEDGTWHTIPMESHQWEIRYPWTTTFCPNCGTRLEKKAALSA